MNRFLVYLFGFFVLLGHGELCAAQTKTDPTSQDENAAQKSPSSANTQNVAPDETEFKIEPAALKELEKTIAEYIQRDMVVGAEIQVIHRGKVLLHKSFGDADREDKKKWTNNTVCNIRSMSKPITSAAAQILIDRKLIELDKPVGHYLKSFQNEKSKSITVRQVLTHRSGLPLTNIFHAYQYKSLQKQVAAAGEKGPQFEPNSKFWYSDSGTDVVAALVEKASGKLLHEFVKAEIFEPLGMNQTVYGFRTDDKMFSTFASLYMGKPGKWTRYWQAHQRAFYPFAWGSQSIYSTTTDYAKFLNMIGNQGRVGDRQILSKEAIARMLAPASRMTMMGSDLHPPNGFRNLESYYGQMMVVHYRAGKEKIKPVILGHSGSDGTNSWMWPEKELTILYFTQSRGGLTPIRIENAIDDLMLNPGPDNLAEVPKKLRPLLGVYIANFSKYKDEPFEVRYRNNKLVLDIPNKLVFELNEPDEKGQWAFALSPDRTKVSFVKNENDQIVALRMHESGKTFEVPKQGIEPKSDRASLKQNKN